MRLCNHSCRWLKPLVSFSHFSSCIWASKSLRLSLLAQVYRGNSQHPKAQTQLIRSDLSSRDTVHRLDDLFSMCSKFVSAWKMNSCRNDAPANLYRFLPCSDTWNMKSAKHHFDPPAFTLTDVHRNYWHYHKTAACSIAPGPGTATWFCAAGDDAAMAPCWPLCLLEFNYGIMESWSEGVSNAPPNQHCNKDSD